MWMIFAALVFVVTGTQVPATFAAASIRPNQLTGAGPRSAAPSDPLTLGQLGPLGPPAGRGRAFYLAGGGSPRLRRIIRYLPRLLCPRGKRRGPRVWR